MEIDLWAKYLERRVVGIDFTECPFGNKCCDRGHWTQLCYSQATGWSQVLYPTFRRCGWNFFISCEKWEPQSFSVELMRF